MSEYEDEVALWDALGVDPPWEERPQVWFPPPSGLDPFGDKVWQDARVWFPPPTRWCHVKQHYIREHRKAAGLTQKQLGYPMNNGGQQGRIERHKSDPSDLAIHCIAEDLGLTVNELMVPPREGQVYDSLRIRHVRRGNPNDTTEITSTTCRPYSADEVGKVMDEVLDEA